MTRRQRRLKAVDEHLDDLLIGRQHPGNPGQVCGGFKSLNTRTVEVINEMKQMRSTVIGWMQESWANEKD